MKYTLVIARNQKQYDLYMFWEVAFSEHGIIKFILKNVVSFFNERTNFYLGYLSGSLFKIKFEYKTTLSYI